MEVAIPEEQSNSGVLKAQLANAQSAIYDQQVYLDDGTDMTLV